MICILSCSLIFPYGMPNSISATEGTWGFGQLTATLGILVIGGQIGHYCASPSMVDPTLVRYKHWWKLSIISLVLRADFPSKGEFVANDTVSPCKRFGGIGIRWGASIDEAIKLFSGIDL